MHNQSMIFYHPLLYLLVFGDGDVIVRNLKGVRMKGAHESLSEEWIFFLRGTVVIHLLYFTEFKSRQTPLIIDVTISLRSDWTTQGLLCALSVECCVVTHLTDRCYTLAVAF